MLPFGKYWNSPAAKGTNNAAVIRCTLPRVDISADDWLLKLNKNMPGTYM